MSCLPPTHLPATGETRPRIHRGTCGNLCFLCTTSNRALLLPSLASLNYTISNSKARPSLLSPGLGWPLSQSLLFVFYCSSASGLYFTDPSSPSSPPSVFLLHTHPPPLSLLEVSPGVLSCLGRSCILVPLSRCVTCSR